MPHLHGNAPTRPIRAIIPYKYQRCGQSKGDALSSQLILWDHTKPLSLDSDMCLLWTFLVSGVWQYVARTWKEVHDQTLQTWGPRCEMSPCTWHFCGQPRTCKQICIVSILRKDWDWKKWRRYIFKRCFLLTRTQFSSPLRHLHVQALSLGII